MGTGLIISSTAVLDELVHPVEKFLVSAYHHPAEGGVNWVLPVNKGVPPVAELYQSAVSPEATVTDSAGMDWLLQM